MNRLLLFCIPAVLWSCSAQERDRNIEIVIQSSQSYTFNLQKGVMTVYYLSKPPTQIKFSLSAKERSEIIDKYYALGLDRMPEVYRLEDECLDMPELRTTIQVKSAARTQTITIEDDCNRFAVPDVPNAGRVQIFLEVVGKILKAKPQIKAASTSDIFYI